jgi:hypothetical protein
VVAIFQGAIGGDTGGEGNMCSNNLADASSIIIDFTPQGSDPGENGDDFIIIDYKLADIEDCSFVIDWLSDADVNVSVGGQDSIWIDIGAPLVERAASGLPAVQDVSTPTDIGWLLV